MTRDCDLMGPTVQKRLGQVPSHCTSAYVPVRLGGYRVPAVSKIDAIICSWGKVLEGAAISSAISLCVFSFRILSHQHHCVETLSLLNGKPCSHQTQ
jgi:hypothetical protein